MNDGRWGIKKIAKEMVVTLLMIFVISMVINYIRKPDINENIYKLELTDIEGKKVNISEYKNRPLVVHFWATWCPTCKFEAPNIERVSKNYKVLTIAVNSGSDELLRTYMQKNGLTYKVINDKTGLLSKRFNIEAYPTTLIYNAKGDLKFTEVGYTTTLGLKSRLEILKNSSTH